MTSSDPREVLRDARARMKPLIGRLAARKDAAEAELEARQKERATLAGEAEAMRAAGRADLADAIAAALVELDARIEQESAAVAQADAALREAQADAAQLEKDEGEVERAKLRGAIDAATRGAGDALSLDPADVALRNVREHAGNLDARVALERELAGDAGGAAGAAGAGAAGDAGTPTPTPTPTPRRETTDADARAQLAALKEARKKKTL